MKTLLQINTSMFTDQGQSSLLSKQFVERWQAANADGKVVVRDIGKNLVPHLTAERFGAFLAKPEERTAEQQAVVDFSDALIAEIKQADVVVLGLPLYNFGVPSTLKAYFDHLARAGVTFAYTANGPQGLLTEQRKVYIFAARGGMYVGTPLDTQSTFVRNFLAFIGITDVEFIYAEGLAMGDASKEAALATAKTKIGELAAA